MEFQVNVDFLLELFSFCSYQLIISDCHLSKPHRLFLLNDTIQFIKSGKDSSKFKKTLSRLPILKSHIKLKIAEKDAILI